jgi:hypothetical protein
MIARATLPGLLTVAFTLAVNLAPASASFGFQPHSFENTILGEDGTPGVQAGSHPFALSTAFRFNTTKGLGEQAVTDENVKDIAVKLPAGLVGDPTATPTCTIEQFNKKNPELSGGFSGASCPDATQVGIAAVELNLTEEEAPVRWYFGIYNLLAPPGVPAQFGFNPIGIPVVLKPELRTGGDYGVTVLSPNVNQSIRIFGVRTTFWGVPAAASHNNLRGECMGLGGESLAEARGHSCPVQDTPRPFLTLPTRCAPEPLSFNIYADSWQHPVRSLEGEGAHEETAGHGAEGRPLALTGCERLAFDPAVSVEPDTRTAASPAGLNVEVALPVNSNPAGLAQAHLKTAVVTLPPAFSASPSAATGLEGCSEQQISLSTSAAPACPDASKLGTVEIETPLLEQSLKGSVYLAQPEANEFHSLLALYLVAEGSGVLVKLAGVVHADPATGQLSTTFEDNPQQPFSHLRLKLFGGPRAPLMTPRHCGSYAASGAMTPWSSEIPTTFTSLFAIEGACGGGFAPVFLAGTPSNRAGAFSPFALTLTRTDQDQAFSRLSVRTPPGLLGMLAGVQVCEEPLIAQQACPQSSQLGHVTVAAGAGPLPLELPQPGRLEDPVYLTSGYGGAPFGLLTLVHAQAGPFDLGTVAVRAKLNVDPHSAQITAVTDPFPAILKGIPVALKTLTITLDRERFMFNPTSCEPLKVEGTVAGDEGATAPLSSRFQAADCAALPFHPSFSVSTQGVTSKVAGASLEVRVAQAPGEAAIAKVDTRLPVELPSRLSTLQKACTDAQFAANPAGCPAGSNVGYAKASTPVLKVPLVGPAYLVSHGGAAFPDLVIILQGSERGGHIRIDLVGHTDIKKGFTYSYFDTVPDAPISSFELVLPEGPHSALAATRNLCHLTKAVTVKSHGKRVKRTVSEPLLTPTTITGQNGAVTKQNTKITVTGCAEARPKAKKAKAKKTGEPQKSKRR